MTKSWRKYRLLNRLDPKKSLNQNDVNNKRNARITLIAHQPQETSQLGKSSTDKLIDNPNSLQTLSRPRILLKMTFGPPNPDVAVPPALRGFGVHGDAAAIESNFCGFRSRITFEWRVATLGVSRNYREDLVRLDLSDRLARHQLRSKFFGM
jgi:hypothetical protein